MVKKRIPTVINDCLDCPFAYIGRGSSEYSVEPHYLCRKTHGTIIIGEHKTAAIPAWCPLPNAIGLSILELDMRERLRHAKRSLELVDNIGKVLDGVLERGVGLRDIITRYNRAQRTKNKGGD